MGIERYFS